MNKLLAAAAVAVVIPAVAHAQSAPAATTTATPKKPCCEKMAHGDGCSCCKGMAAGEHGARGANAPGGAAQADPHQGHKP